MTPSLWLSESNKITSNQCEKQVKALGEENSAALQHLPPQLTVFFALHLTGLPYSFRLLSDIGLLS